ncbi:site-specific integrase [Vibrio crassostreae]|uniref:site-specific integrase n=1 Tax=Vibrio crassostreae TaxID=246167 RepID=UPI000F49EC1A|nr:site-specific integrase [Vibrio crassostreae]ROQ74301.1 hypothetical protein EDB72_3802 [Vibrio crassostreae]
MKDIKNKNNEGVSSEEFFADVGIDIDYINDVLIPTIESGDWDYLEKLTVIDADNCPVMFSHNIWEISALGQGYQHQRLLFNHSTRKGFEGYILPRDLRNEIKCFAALELLTEQGKYGYASIVDTVGKLTQIALIASEVGISSFSQIDEEAILLMIDHGLKVDDKGNKNLSAINRMVQVQDHLPIDIEINRILKPSHFSKVSQQTDQYLTIPYKIYFDLLRDAISDIEEVFDDRKSLEEAVRKYILHSKLVNEECARRVRYGELELESVILSDEIIKKLSDAFCEHNVPIVDNGKNYQWLSVWSSCEVTSIHGAQTGEVWSSFEVKVGKRLFTSRADFAEYIRNLNSKAAFLAMALSAMRIGELFELSPVYGAQDHIKIGAGTVYCFTTKQEKLTLDSQTADDVYVTNLAGFKSFHVLNAIHRPYRKMFVKGSNSKFFAALSEPYNPKPIDKTGLGKTINDTIKRIYKGKLTLTIEDVDALRVSDPSHSNLPSVGEQFPYTNHQCRRSFAFYVIGLELMDFPQLKQQLGHISKAMTRWYARNAHSFKTLYSELSEERAHRSSRTLARIYNRLANKERLAGGYGKSLSKEVIENNNYFSEGVNGRKLSAEYWKEQIQAGKVHIHAIGKGMYCTKISCSVRAAIDLSECTDCAWDILEDATVAESLRMTAMRNLLVLQESDELNGSSAAKLVMDIRSAEKVMLDLGFPHETFVVPQGVAQLIPATNV